MYAIKVRYHPEDWIYVTAERNKPMLFETREEAEAFRKIWNGEGSKVVEYTEPNIEE